MPMAELALLMGTLMSGQLVKIVAQGDLRSKFIELEQKMTSIRALLDDAEEKQLEDEGVKMWVEELQNLLYDMEDILAEYATESLRRKLKIEEHQSSTSMLRKLIPAGIIGFNPRASKFMLNMRSKINDITNRLKDLYERRHELGFLEFPRERSAVSWQRPLTTSFPTESVIYGREEDEAKILEILLGHKTDEANVGVISIVGMPGVGKTVLAQQVYNGREAREYFQLEAWVCVSNDFDVMGISKAVLESFSGRHSDLKYLNSIQAQLRDEVDGRRFLLVLDDVWSEDYSAWGVLLSVLKAGAQGSKIIVTTRHESVALTMTSSGENCHRLRLLSDDACWLLFKRHAFGKRVMGVDPSELIRQKVIEKCKGVPLVAKTFGDLLRSKRREKWFDILSTNLWELDKDNEILTAFQMSYYHLPRHLKRCFAYCAILPKGYEIEEKELVLLWIAEGLIQQSSGDKQLEDLGGEYFHDLLSRSIFLRSSKSNTKFIMHDHFNDLAQMVSQNVTFRLEDELVSNNQLKASEKTRYASYICHEYNDKRRFEVFKDAMHLRTFLQVLSNDCVTTCYISNRVVSNLLWRFKKLRVLSLRNYYMVELPYSIGVLRLLRYLNLSDSKIKSLPKSVNSMFNLQILILRNCCRLKLPYNMGNLINLRHFDILGASSINEMPMGIRKWKCLQTLSNFIVGKSSGSSLKDLKHLKSLCGELHISSLENVNDCEAIIEFILCDKKDLKVLLLEWGSRLDESMVEEVDMKTLEMLQPHQDLEKLTIKGYRGTTFPAWAGDAFFSESKMTILELIDCKNCTFLPSIGLLGSLKSLTIKGMKGIKSVGLEFFGEHCLNPFKSLEILCVENLEAWESWDPVKENESFPMLQELSIVNCPKLSERLPNNLSFLKKLVIRGCEQLVVSISSIPRLRQLELDNCKKIVCSSSTNFKSLEFMTISHISDFDDWSRQEFQEVGSLKIDGCDELINLWHNEIESPKGFYGLGSLRELDFKNCNILIEGFQNMHAKELRIEGCDSLNFIFRGKLPQSLKKLHIENCKTLQYLVNDNENTCTSSSSTTMPKEGVNEYTCTSSSSTTMPKESVNDNTCTSSSSTTMPKEGVNEYTCTSSSSTTMPKESVNENTCTSSSSTTMPKESNSTSASLLEELHIGGCPSCLPSIDRLSAALTCIHISDCSKLITLSGIGQLPVALKRLEILDCSELTALLLEGHLPETLETLSIHGCPKLELIVQNFQNNTALHTINILGCGNLPCLPDGLHSLTSVCHISITDCKGFVCFPEGGFPNTNLRVDIKGCCKLKALPRRMHTLYSFKELSISDCPNLSLSEEGLPANLASLFIQGLKQYKPLIKWGLHKFISLRDLHISGGTDGESFQEQDMSITLPRTLTRLRIGDFSNLKYFPFKNFKDLRFLECLTIENCPKLISIPSLPSSILRLNISHCPLLKIAWQKDKEKLANIPCIYIEDKFIYY